MIRDRWYTYAPDGTGTRTPEHGHGSRWEVVYRDRLGSRSRKRRFEYRADADAFNRDMDAVYRGDLSVLPGVTSRQKATWAHRATVPRGSA
jgi:hypothetical protein